MSTLKVVSLQHPSSGTVNAALTSGGLLTGAGLDLIATSTFSSVSSVSVNNCFTSTYQNYRVMFDATMPTAQVQIRMRASSVDDSTASAYVTRGAVSTTTVAVWNQTTTYWYLGAVTNTSRSTFSLDVCRPQQAVTTHFSGTGYQDVDNQSWQIAGYHTLATAYDGLSLLTSSGTFSGTLRIYGYRNS